ncbi:ATP cone domain-containing protein [Namhaeicola litoreus]|uniref:ATP cone domain-containing protein n=1 Tax=Namhaeicola litoreus TaxID=1052145 RepID=A0ABW3Y2V1_9FLAO
MEEDSVKIRKYSGELVDFDIEKLKRSLRKSKVTEALIEQIANEIDGSLYEGMTTKQIYSAAYKMLKSNKSGCASLYKLKKAIMELGPSGFPFEKFVAAIIEAEGFKTEVGVFVQGHCVMHEVDVVATNKVKQYMVECKYHNTQGRVNDVKIPLYIQSRFVDINTHYKHINGHQALFQEGWVYTNTRFSSDAIDYGRCMGLKLVSWDYPKGKSLIDKIEQFKLYPITTLVSLSKNDKIKLLESGVVLCKELWANPDVLMEAHIDRKKHNQILSNCHELCKV